MQVKTLNKVMLAGCTKSGAAPTATKRLLLTSTGSAAAQLSPQPTPSVAMKATIKNSSRTNGGTFSGAFSRRQFSSRRDNNKGRHGSPGRSHSPGSPIAPRRSRGSSFDQLKNAVKQAAAESQAQTDFQTKKKADVFKYDSTT